MKVTERLDVPGTYVVESGSLIYNCDLRDPFSPSCDCPDHLYRERTCKHLLLSMQLRDGELE